MNGNNKKGKSNEIYNNVGKAKNKDGNRLGNTETTLAEDLTASQVSSNTNSRKGSENLYTTKELNNKKPNVTSKSGKEEKKTTNYKNYNELPVYPAKYSDSDNSEDEGMDDYKVGGYHPVHVGYYR